MTWGPTAHADPAATVALRLDYRGAGSCPDEASFFAELRARSRRIRRAEPGEPAYTARVTLRELTLPEVGAVGDLDLQDVDARTARRELEGHACPEVAHALALVIALDAVGAAAVPPPPPPVPLPSAPPPPLVPDWPAVPARATVTEAAPPAMVSPPSTAERSAPPRWSPMVVALAGFRSGVAPSLSPVGALALGVDRTPQAEGGAARSLASAVLVSVAYATVDAAGSGDSVAFHLVSAALDACAWRAPLGPRVTLMPCARLEGGYHFAEVTSGSSGTAGAAFASAGLKVWLRVQIAGGFFGSAAADVAATLAPATFTEEGAKVAIFQTPPVTAGMNFGLGMSFP